MRHTMRLTPVFCMPLIKDTALICQEKRNHNLMFQINPERERKRRPPGNINHKIVSIRKWPFCAISVSICRITCAAYIVYASAQSLEFLELAQNCLFPNWKLHCVRAWFPDGHKIAYGYQGNVILIKKCVAI